MEELSLLEKFKVLFDNIFEHPLFIVLLLVPAIMFLLQKKHGQKAFVLVYLLVIIFVLYIGGEVIFELFDNLMNGLFMTLYFPNFITLFIVVVLCSIIALVSFFSKKMYRINKIINITGFAIVQMLFVLTLTVIRSNNIDIYADNALYTNNDVLTLMQLLIGTFALQMIAILIINGINKVTDILDKRTTPLGQDMEKQIDKLEKTKNSLINIKNVKIDNTKVGYINVADKKKTSKPLLKPFKFDLDKLESITINLPNTSQEIVLKEEPLIEEKPKFDIKEKFDESLKKIKNKKAKPKKRKKVLLPKERSTPIVHDVKPDLLKPMGTSFVHTDLVDKRADGKFISSQKPLKADSFKPEIQVVGEVAKPKLVKNDKPIDLVDNLNILDIQSTLDTVIRYKLMRVNLQNGARPEGTIDNLQIPNFNYMLKVFKKYKLYKTTG